MNNDFEDEGLSFANKICLWAILGGAGAPPGHSAPSDGGQLIPMSARGRSFGPALDAPLYFYLPIYLFVFF